MLTDVGQMFRREHAPMLEASLQHAARELRADTDVALAAAAVVPHFFV